MADIEDEDPNFNENPNGSSPNNNDDQEAQFEAELAQQTALIPPELYDTLKPLLLLSSVANYMLMGHGEDPVPQALEDLLGYNIQTLRSLADVNDTSSLARAMATHTLQLFDFILIGRLVFESSLDAPLRTYLARHSPPEEEFAVPREYILKFSESLLDNLGQYLAAADEDMREELHMRRLQTESIFARLDDTLRPYYPPGHSPADDRAHVLDATDEAEDQEEAAVHITFNEAQRVTLGTALRLPPLLAELGETPFARALADVPRFRRKALERLATRLAASDADEPFRLTWSELLRLYQAAQVCALSTVTDVLTAGSLEDLMFNNAAQVEEDPEQAAEFAHHARELMTMMMAGFVEVVEANHPDDEEVAEAKAEISRLAELLTE